MNLEDEISVPCYHGDLREKIGGEDLKIESTDFDEFKRDSESSDSDTEVEEENNQENPQPTGTLPVANLENEILGALEKNMDIDKSMLADLSIPTGTKKVIQGHQISPGRNIPEKVYH